jgi:ferritin-like metal-binding protein YciE
VPNASSLEDLVIVELSDLLDAERQLTKALPKLAKKARAEELRAALEEHLEQTKQQVDRLTQAFEALGRPARAHKCVGMRGIVEEGEEHLEKATEQVLDAVLIAAAQKAEHYEIAAYGTARAHATRLGYEDVSNLLEQTLDEEKAADEKLTAIAESLANPEAAEHAGEEEQPTARKASNKSLRR